MKLLTDGQTDGWTDNGDHNIIRPFGRIKSEDLDQRAAQEPSDQGPNILNRWNFLKNN